VFSLILGKVRKGASIKRLIYGSILQIILIIIIIIIIMKLDILLFYQFHIISFRSLIDQKFSNVSMTYIGCRGFVVYRGYILSNKFGTHALWTCLTLKLIWNSDQINNGRLTVYFYYRPHAYDL